jgi:Tfp pilus assembly protein PilV
MSTSGSGPIPRGGAAGFTLIEAVASIGLLSIVILGTAVGADRATRYTEYSRTATTAMTLVHDELEQLQAKVSTGPEFTAGNHADPNNPITSLGTAGGTYTRTWTVTADTPMTGLKTVALQVTWSLNGQTQTVREVIVK